VPPQRDPTPLTPPPTSPTPIDVPPDPVGDPVETPVQGEQSSAGSAEAEDAQLLRHFNRLMLDLQLQIV
jgi:hypothetical protein